MARLLTNTAARREANASINRADLAAALGDGALAERVIVRVSNAARRFSLRIDPATAQVTLTCPPRSGKLHALAFIASKHDWIRPQLDALPPAIPFADGSVIPVFGISHVIRFVPDQRGGVWREGNQLYVTGRAEHAPRRLRDWLRLEAKRIIGPLVRDMAERLDRDVSRVTIRDTTSQWGSCSHGGQLSFSWRLLMAPHDVLAYVVAHEVAHLKHMDHGPGFWRTVHSLVENGECGVNSAHQWLRRHGVILHRYG